MRKVLLLFCIICMLGLAGCQKEEAQVETTKVISQGSNTKEGWWLKRNKEHQQPEFSQNVDLSKYDAYSVDTKAKNKKVMYLTFDCGYENGATPAILDALKKHQVPAAFFVVGNFVRDNPDLIQRMTKEGHTVGNHTFSHPDMSKISSLESFQKELSAVEALYQKITGTDMIKYYRPPQGIYSTENLKMAQSLGYHTFFWSLAYVDWQQDAQPTHEEAFDKLLSRVHPGAIVLLHNTSRTNGEIMDELLSKWEEMGYTFGSLSDLIKESV